MTNKNSPFVTVQNGDAFKIHTYMSGGSVLSISIDKLTNPIETLDDIKAVEDFYLHADDIPGEMILLAKENIDSPVADTQVNAATLSVNLMRAATEVVKRQRRGMANIVLCHPDIAALMGVGSPLPLAQISGEGGETKGRWTFAGTINHSLAIWTSTDLPTDKVWAAYVGSNDYDAPTSRRTEDGKYEVFAKASVADEHFYTLTLAYE
ncbi:MAG: hypothetical protein DI537_45535 [Stutzerimonas stutzeri]|nr:MAG: hypothetical protein DI537_45535 [Stutzerimonas stutzeri]